MTDDLLVYGSYGYSGSLIVERAVEEGLSPVLAGRRAEPVERQATDLGLDHRVFSLEHPRVVERHLDDFEAVLNCAGPFTATADPLVTACLETGTDYLDLAGQIDVLEELADRDRDAEDADVILLPAVGFDVVPTDCLAAYLHTRLDGATGLTLAIDGLGTFSPGTVKSIIEGFSRPGAVRKGGEIRSVPPAWKTRRIDFGRGEKPTVTIPWGDVSAAYYTTGVPDVETYASVPEYAAEAMRATRSLAPAFGARPVRSALKAVADAVVSGPTAAERARSTTRIWGEVVDGEGGRAAARMLTPDTYDVTARTAVESARRVVDDDVAPGFQTPASAFGPDYILAFEGVEREDVEELAAVGVGE